MVKRQKDKYHRKYEDNIGRMHKGYLIVAFVMIVIFSIIYGIDYLFNFGWFDK